MKEEESLNNSMEDHQEADQINHRPHHQLQPYNGGGGGREDCWSEGATATLIEAWGDRYLQLSRGNLRQKDWKEVADAVNDRQDSVNKPRRTDIQCKNRIDTVKKKYKIEKAKSAPSKWPFYSRLDHLIGTTTTPASNKKFIQMPSRILRAKRNPNPNPNGVVFSGGSTASRSLKGIRNPNPNSNMYPGGSSRSLKGFRNPNLNPNGVAFSGGSSSRSRLKSEGLSESSDEGDDDDDDLVFDGGVKKHRMDTDSSDESAFRGLARAIAKFGEIYERIESSKQQQMMELERQKMELTKELEFQRMKMFMDTQLEIEKKKHSKYASGTGKKL